jgi:lysophospholipase L1-like esterase
MRLGSTIIKDLRRGTTEINYVDRGTTDIWQRELLVTGRNTLFGYGDSITTGSNATTTANRYINKLATLYTMTLTNRGASGRGVFRMAQQGIVDTYTRANTLLTCMAGLNDIRRGGTDPRTLKKIEACYRVMAVKAISGTTTASGAAGVTRVGTFANYSANLVGGVYTNTGSTPATFTSTNGSYWEWSFTGTAFGINFIANSGDVQTFGTASVYVDGVFVEDIFLNDWYDNISDGTYDNRRGSLSWSWHNYANTSHTVRVVANGGIVPIDFFCTIQSSFSNCAAVLFSEIPYLSTTGYAISPANGSVAISNSASEVIYKVYEIYSALGFPINMVWLNDFWYILSSGLATDQIHPNNTGHDQIFQAFSNRSR